ncbi:MAG TPA: hypothetical protein DCE42_20225, partial [Myxococcales bacterium]|nr:hypothetical protein [Myxococcales bacterium]
MVKWIWIGCCLLCVQLLSVPHASAKRARTAVFVSASRDISKASIALMQKTLRASLHLARNFEVMTSQDMLRNMLRFPGTIEQCGDRKCLHKLRRHLRIRRLLLARLSLRRGRTKIRFYWVSWRKNRRFTTWYLQRHDEPFSFFAMRVAGRLLSRKWMWAGRRRRTK